MNGTEETPRPDQFEAVTINPLALPPFPTWPPPSGGYPVTVWEQSPKLNPFPYGTNQPANLSIAGTPPAKLATRYPMAMPKGANGQNQAAPAGWPVWPKATKFTTLPDKAPPSLSQLP